MIESLPCGSCTALCCGPVSLSRDRLVKIETYIAQMPAPERNRLRRQKRGPLDCGFLDMSNHRCAIYPVRPWVCEAFGRVEGMRCPKVAKLVQIIPAFLADQAVRDEGASGIVGNSGEYLWRK